MPQSCTHNLKGLRLLDFGTSGTCTCLLDEFGKVNNELISSSEFSSEIILESMEQRCISISKEFLTLQADRCSIIAAANRVEGIFSCVHVGDTGVLYLQIIRLTCKTLSHFSNSGAPHLS
jgi:DNA replicative helicase MCM subunit Mcm2 (Cdc46/Mcm family)